MNKYIEIKRNLADIYITIDRSLWNWYKNQTNSVSTKTGRKNSIFGDWQVLPIKTGGVAEWLIAMVLKTIVPQGTGGSNPSSSVRK
jgi:hypothetical protein